MSNEFLNEISKKINNVPFVAKAVNWVGKKLIPNYTASTIPNCSGTFFMGTCTIGCTSPQYQNICPNQWKCDTGSYFYYNNGLCVKATGYVCRASNQGSNCPNGGISQCRC